MLTQSNEEQEKTMHNKFLEELAHEPIANTFKLVYKLLLSNKFLFAVITIIFIFLSMSPYLIPFIIRGGTGHISIVLIGLISAILSIVSQVFTESNYLYICKKVLESQSEEECVGTMASTKVSVVFTNYFVRALGSSLAIVLIVMPFIVIREELYMGEYWDMFLMLLLVLALYVYSIVAYKITLSKNFKEAFVATFSLFSPSVWTQSFNASYGKFVISMMLILSGIFFMLNFFIENASDISNTVMSIAMMLIMTIFSMFIALYILPIAMMIAQSLTEKSNRK